MNHRIDETSAQPAMDAALRSLGTAAPAPGMEGRILARLAAARRQTRSVRPALPRFSVTALRAVFASLICTAVVVGSVSHSRHAHPVVAPPVLPLSGHGIGAASAVHPAAPPSAPIPAGPSARGARHGRARIAPHAHKAPGVAVPDPNSTPQN